MRGGLAFELSVTGAIDAQRGLRGEREVDLEARAASSIEQDPGKAQLVSCPGDWPGTTTPRSYRPAVVATVSNRVAIGLDRADHGEARIAGHVAQIERDRRDVSD